jgi:uncharacterized Zn-binding protein involved in type VI secretion
MPSVQRQGDPNDSGGTASGGFGSVRANGKPVVVAGTGVTGHAPWGRRQHPPHASAVTTGGIGSVRAGGTPVNVDGDADTCGHTRTSGSSDVRAGG